MKILITGAFPLSEEERRELERQGHDVSFQQDERNETKNPEQYDAVVCNNLFQSNPIELFSALKMIQLTSAGLDRVPLRYIREHGIELHNASGIYSIPMAEFAVGGVLQLYKQSRAFRESQRSHQWIKQRGLLELNGKTVCIVGTGDVGREKAKRLKAFGCRVVGVNRTVRSVDGFDQVLPLSDLKVAAASSQILMCSIALTEETRGLIDGEVLAALPYGAVLVNVSRGALASEKELIAWLWSGRAGGAVLDVFETEPLSPDSPLWDMENVILTPHNSYVGEGNRIRLWELVKRRFRSEGSA